MNTHSRDTIFIHQIIGVSSLISMLLTIDDCFFFYMWHVPAYMHHSQYKCHVVVRVHYTMLTGTWFDTV